MPQRGLQIAHVDLNLVREAFQFRICLETEAVALFATSASEATIADLVRQHRDILSAALAGDGSPELEARAQAVDWAMHNAFIDAMGNSIISNAYRVNSIKMRLIHQERFRIDGRITEVMGEHLKVLDALQRRSAPEAVAALLAHIQHARDRALHWEIRAAAPA